MIVKNVALQTIDVVKYSWAGRTRKLAIDHDNPKRLIRDVFEEDVTAEVVLLNKGLPTLGALVCPGPPFGSRGSVFFVRGSRHAAVTMLHVPFELSLTPVVLLTDTATQDRIQR